jgi:polyvinyl alcohol dehydrogenase (cytochrome)
MRLATTLLSLTVLAPFAAPAAAQGRDGAAVFQAACASCHANPAADSRAPNPDALKQISPESVYTTLISGSMFRQGSTLTDAERRAVAGFVTGRPLGTAAPPSTVGRCAATPALPASAVNSGWNGWGGDPSNTRYQPGDKSGVNAANVSKLTLKWAFGFAGVNSARAQPAVAGGRLFVGSDNGDVYALNAKTGCTYWTYHAQTGIRTAMSVGPYKPARGPAGLAVFFADNNATAYAVDAATGKELWSHKVDDHTYAKSTGSPTFYNGRLYVTVAGVGEEGQGGTQRYECCTFRGSVTSIDVNTGKVVWKTYSIAEEPKPRAKNKEGVQTWGPAGGGIWSAPTIDPKRRLIYVTTGNGYSDPPQRTTDALLAIDMETGKIRWSSQPGVPDTWAGGCRADVKDNANCPEAVGPDHDFSMSPVLAKRSDGRDILIAQSKSGMAYAFDPDREGAVLWSYKTSQGSGLGGQWGATADTRNVYFGVVAQNPGGMRAVKLDNGQEVWAKNAAEKLCGSGRGCSGGMGGALTMVPGVVFSGSNDGGIRAYSAADGSIVWQFDTNKQFETVNGVKANGGAMDGPGAVVTGGMLYMSSGYVSLGGRPGNVLLAFGVD